MSLRRRNHYYFNLTSTIDNMIGRTAHIQFLENSSFLKALVHCTENIFQWFIHTIISISYTQQLHPYPDTHCHHSSSCSSCQVLFHVLDAKFNLWYSIIHLVSSSLFAHYCWVEPSNWVGIPSTCWYRRSPPSSLLFPTQKTHTSWIPKQSLWEKFETRSSTRIK